MNISAMLVKVALPIIGPSLSGLQSHSAGWSGKSHHCEISFWDHVPILVGTRLQFFSSPSVILLEEIPVP